MPWPCLLKSWWFTLSLGRECPDSHTLVFIITFKSVWWPLPLRNPKYNQNHATTSIHVSTAGITCWEQQIPWHSTSTICLGLQAPGRAWCLLATESYLKTRSDKNIQPANHSLAKPSQSDSQSFLTICNQLECYKIDKSKYRHPDLHPLSHFIYFTLSNTFHKLLLKSFLWAPQLIDPSANG